MYFSYFVIFLDLFFFFNQKTAYEMRISDWSSDVCSSDLLPAELQNSLLGMSRVRRLVPGHRLFQRGDPPCGMYAVLEGAVRIGAVNEQGKEALLSVVGAPHWFGEICLFDGQPRTHDAVGVGQCTLQIGRA